MKKALGILGGMGPQATVDFLQNIVKLTDAQGDQQHMRVYVDNHPQIPDRIAAVLDGVGDPLPALRESLEKLEGCGAQVIAMPCITAHFYYPALSGVSTAQFLDMPSLAAAACAGRYPGQAAGVLSSVATARSGVFLRAMEQAGVPVIRPSEGDQQELGRLILNVKADRDPLDTARRFSAVLEATRRSGADYFVLACTELPVIVRTAGLSGDFVDPALELAKGAVTACGYRLRQ